MKSMDLTPDQLYNVPKNADAQYNTNNDTLTKNKLDRFRQIMTDKKSKTGGSVGSVKGSQHSKIEDGVREGLKLQKLSKERQKTPSKSSSRLARDLSSRNGLSHRKSTNNLQAKSSSKIPVKKDKSQYHTLTSEGTKAVQPRN